MYKYMCEICKNILLQKDPKLANRYVECKCTNGICKFDQRFKHILNDSERFKLMVKYWKDK